MKYNIILFDLDGTLTDPKLGITKSVQYALSKFSISETNLEKLTPFIGPTLQDSFKKYYGFDDDKAWKAVQYYREYFSKQGMLENKVYQGIKELLQKLYNNKKTLYVVTSKPTCFSEQIIKHFNLEKYFKQVIGPELNLKKSSKADMIERVLKKYPNEDKKTFIMIGDKEHDVAGAKEMGIDSIAVTFGHGNLEELNNANPTYIVHSIKQLETLLND